MSDEVRGSQSDALKKSNDCSSSSNSGSAQLIHDPLTHTISYSLRACGRKKWHKIID